VVDAGLPDVAPSSAAPISECLGAANNQQWSATLAMLERLETLLPTFTAGTPPKSCMTDVWASLDPAAASLESALKRDFDQTERARRSAWLNGLPRDAVWLRAFIPGVSRATVRGSSLTFDTEPMLTQRVNTEQITAVAGPQHCVVLAAQVSGSNTTLWCGEPSASRDEAAFTVSIPDETVRARLGTLALGDVVRFGAYLALVGDIPRGESSVSRWRFEDVPANEVEVVARGTCCPH